MPDDLAEAAKSAAGGRPPTKAAQESVVLGLLRANRADDAVLLAFLERVHDTGLSRRDLLVLASMEYMDVQIDVERALIKPGQGYRVRQKLLESMRKLTDDDDEPMPHLLRIVFEWGGFDRKGDAGAEMIVE